MSKAVAKKEQTALAVHQPVVSNLAFDPSDVMIPHILIAQAMSTVVQDGEMKPGSIYRSTTKKVLSEKDEGVQIIPLHMTKTWILSKRTGGRYEFAGVEPYTAKSKDLPWKWEENGVEWKREASLNFYALLPKDVEADAAARKAFAETGEFPDTDDTLLPCHIAFKSSSYRMGKVLVTHFAKAQEFGVPAYSNTFRLKTKKQTNDQGTFYTFEVERDGKTSAEYFDSCGKWTSIVSQQNVRVDSPEEAPAGGDTVDGVPF